MWFWNKKKKALTLEEALAVARDPQAAPEQLAQLAKSEFAYVRETVAQRAAKKEFLDKILKAGNANPEFLMTFLDDADGEVRRSVAAHPHTPAAALKSLLCDDVSTVREAAAKNANLPRAALDDFRKRWSADELVAAAVSMGAPEGLVANIRKASVGVDGIGARIAAASLPDATPELLKHLAATPNSMVKFRVAANKNAPIEILEAFAQDGTSVLGFEYGYLKAHDDDSRIVCVGDGILLNPAAPSRLIEACWPGVSELCAYDGAPSILFAEHRNTPAAILDELLGLRIDATNFAVIQHENASADTLRRLASDPLNSEGVRSAARKKLAERGEK